MPNLLLVPFKIISTLNMPYYHSPLLEKVILNIPLILILLYFYLVSLKLPPRIIDLLLMSPFYKDLSKIS